MRVLILALFILSSCKLFPTKESASKKPAHSIQLINAVKNIKSLTEFSGKITPGRNIKIAIFDNGFEGWEKEVGVSLPSSTDYFRNNHSLPLETEHGTHMAEIVYYTITELVGSKGIVSPQLYLFNTNGYSNLKDSLIKSIELGVDFILYAQVWPYGSNFDGTGYLHVLVNKAVANNIIWFNAAGNFAENIWRGKLILNNNKEALFEGLDNKLQFQITKDGAVTISLTWNDFSKDPMYAAKQDLNLELLNSSGGLIAQSLLAQSPLNNSARPSQLARETIHRDLKAGTYYLRVSAASDNFTEASQFQIAIHSESSKIVRPKPSKVLLFPADHPKAITVGAIDFPRSSFSTTKPDILLPSRVELRNKGSIRSSSTAVAIACGIAASYSYYNETKPNSTEIKTFLKRIGH